MPPDREDVRKWAELVQTKCRVERQEVYPHLVQCAVHKHPISMCADMVAFHAMYAVPALFDAWAEEGAQAEFYRDAAKALAQSLGEELGTKVPTPRFEDLTPQEQSAMRSQFRKKAGIR